VTGIALRSDGWFPVQIGVQTKHLRGAIDGNCGLIREKRGEKGEKGKEEHNNNNKNNNKNNTNRKYNMWSAR
jgi:hypothetical protein